MPLPFPRPLLAGLVSLAFVAPASAAVILDFVDTGAGVVDSFSGSLSLSGMTLVGGGGSGGDIHPTQGFFSSIGTFDTYLGSFTPTPYGTGGFGGPSSSSGDRLSLRVIPGFGSLLGVSAGYVAGSPPVRNDDLLHRQHACQLGHDAR